jgi:polyisoprenoid-binding protein YceI
MKLTQSRHWIVALTTGLLAAQTCASTWKSVAGESSLEFTTTFEGAEASGRFEQFKVDLNLDPAQLAESFLIVQVDIASATFGGADIDEAIAQAEWFDTKTFPHAEFKSNSIRHVGGANYAAEGLVSIKGVNKPLNVPHHWSENGQSAVITGELILSRLEFGIGSGAWATDPSIGYPVQVRFEVHLVIQP